MLCVVVCVWSWAREARAGALVFGEACWVDRLVVSGLPSCLMQGDPYLLLNHWVSDQ